MEESIYELNELEVARDEQMKELLFIIPQLIENIKNNIPNIHSDTEKYIKDRLYISTKNEPYWHFFFSQGETAMSGDYPDEECEDHAYSFGLNMFKRCEQELYNLPIDILEDILIYINDHMTKGKCVHCEW